MKVAVFSSKSYDEQFLQAANSNYNHELVFFEPRLTAATTILAAGFPAVCLFVNDRGDATILKALADKGTRLIALRCAGFNQIDLQAAADLGITVVRVPAYSPYAVAEHAVGLILTLNRQLHRAYQRVREDNFSLQGLLGFDLHGKTAGIVGAGKIGAIVAKILHGFGCKLLAYDLYPNDYCKELGVECVPLPELYANADIITLHCPLTAENYHLVDASALEMMKPGVMLINTSRGPLVDAKAAIAALKSGKLGYLGLDVYEGESSLFFEDLSTAVVQDDVFQRLLTFPNVVITGHQAFFTDTALKNIAETTLANVADVEAGNVCANEVGMNK